MQNYIKTGSHNMKSYKHILQVTIEKQVKMDKEDLSESHILLLEFIEKFFIDT